MDPSEAITKLKPLLDHASTQGFQWHFELLFFLLVGVVVFMAWTGGKIIQTFVKAKIAADEAQQKQYAELTLRLRAVEDEGRKIAEQYAVLQGRSVSALEEVADAIRELRSYFRHPNQNT